MATIVLFLIAYRQLKSGVRVSRQQAVLDAHRQWTSGEIGDSRRRLAAYLYEKRPARKGRCGTWDPALDGGSRYKISVRTPATPRDDAFVVMRFFARLHAGYFSRAFDRQMVASLFGYHVLWWSEVFHYTTSSSMSDRDQLEALKKEISSSSADLEAKAKKDFA